MNDLYSTVRWLCVLSDLLISHVIYDTYPHSRSLTVLENFLTFSIKVDTDCNLFSKLLKFHTNKTKEKLEVIIIKKKN